MTTIFFIFVTVAFLDSGYKLRELGLVFRADLSKSEDSSSLLVNNSSETSLALNNTVRNTHLTAESRKKDDELNGVDIVGNQDERSLLVLNKTNNVVKAVLDGIWLLADILLFLALGDSSSLLVETLLLLDLRLWAVFVEKLEALGSEVAVKSIRELRYCWGNLKTEIQDLLLSLKTDVLGPFDEAGEVTTGLDILADTEVARTLLKERVLNFLARTSLSLGERRGCDFLTGLWRLSLRKRDQQIVCIYTTCCIFF